MRRLKIVHFINENKFTLGYIRFFNEEFTDIEHYFITTGAGWNKNSDEIQKHRNTIIINRWINIKHNKHLETLINDCDVLIISGMSCICDQFFVLSDSALNKTYLQFWGRDFYFLRDKINIFKLRRFFRKHMLLHVSDKCAGLIFLISGEYEIFHNLTGISKNNYIAPMPEDEEIYELVLKYKDISSKGRNVLVGNSATETNKHIEVFKLLSSFTNINVYAPLSYGNNEYCKRVIENGEKIFGKNFHPIVNYMDHESYVKLLSEMDVAIFNNNRQQGMGNINILLGLGKKVYIRKDTSMWQEYKNRGYILHEVEEINNADVGSLFNYDEVEIKNNISTYDFYDSRMGLKRRWIDFFDVIKNEAIYKNGQN